MEGQKLYIGVMSYSAQTLNFAMCFAPVLTTTVLSLCMHEVDS